jgi:hypothetical protein
MGYKDEADKIVGLMGPLIAAAGQNTLIQASKTFLYTKLTDYLKSFGNKTTYRVAYAKAMVKLGLDITRYHSNRILASGMQSHILNMTGVGDKMTRIGRCDGPGEWLVKKKKTIEKKDDFLKKLLATPLFDIEWHFFDDNDSLLNLKRVLTT